MSELESKYAKDTAIARIVHLERENAELREDKARLDWLLNDASMAHLCWAANGREQIDKAMEEAIREREAGNHI